MIKKHKEKNKMRTDETRSKEGEYARMLRNTLTNLHKPIRVRCSHKGGTYSFYFDGLERTGCYPNSSCNFWYIPDEEAIYLYLQSGYNLLPPTDMQNERIRKRTTPNKRAARYSLAETQKVLATIKKKGRFNLESFVLKVLYEASRAKGEE